MVLGRGTALNALSKVSLMSRVIKSLHTLERTQGIGCRNLFFDGCDGSLLAGFAAGDDRCASWFIERFRGQVVGIARAVLRDDDAVEDVSQLAFERMLRRAHTFDLTRGPLRAWVMAIARSTAIDHLRGVRRRGPTGTIDHDELVSAEPDPADTAVVIDQLRRVRAALDRLPAEQRRAVLLAAWHARTAVEIADLEGVPVGTAKTRIRDGLGRLRVEMRD
jgi:RNA polymerase sigma factor (sigma-70 family)